MRYTLQSIGCDVYRQLVKDKENLCFSPLSFLNMIMVLLSGSKTKWLSNLFHPFIEDDIQHQFQVILTTLTQSSDSETKWMSNFFHQFTEKEIRDQLQSALTPLTQEKSPLIVSQGLFVDPHLGSLRKAFMHTVEQYRADVNLQCPFTDDPNTCVALVNHWVNQSTRGKITHMIDQLSPDTLFVLLNAFYFKDDWRKPFHSPYLGDFYITPEKRVQTQLMYYRGVMPYGQHVYGEAIQLPYRDSRFGFLVILPTTSTHMDALEQDLSPDLIDDIIASMSSREIDLTLPRFRVVSTLPMDQTCQALGIPMSDWSHISQNLTSASLTILQKAIIDVNQRGTEATAVTVATLFGCTYTPPHVLVNRPFLFAIMEKRSNLMLFMGRYQVPDLD